MPPHAPTPVSPAAGPTCAVLMPLTRTRTRLTRLPAVLTTNPYDRDVVFVPNKPMLHKARTACTWLPLRFLFGECVNTEIEK